MGSKTGSICPQCRGRIVGSRHVFRRGFRCPQCGVRLLASANYLRILFIAAIAIGFALAWEARIRGVGLFLWGLLAAFLVSIVLVRIAPYIVGPRFVLNDPEYVTTLSLTDKSKEYSARDPKSILKS